MKGKLIVIEGTDGSGKATQTKRLYDQLVSEGFSVEVLEFPNYRTPACAMVEEYLNGRLGTAEEVGPYRASILYAVDRYGKSREMHQWLDEGKIILCNRYMTANKGHQAGKIHSLPERDKFLEWLDDLEFNIFQIPRPDQVILLFMPHEIAHNLVANKDLRAYLGGKRRDIHEEDLKHLRDAEEAYLYVAKRESWDVIECSDGKNPLPIDAVFGKVYSCIRSSLDKN